MTVPANKKPLKLGLVLGAVIAVAVAAVFISVPYVNHASAVRMTEVMLQQTERGIVRAHDWYQAQLDRQQEVTAAMNQPPLSKDALVRCAASRQYANGMYRRTFQTPPCTRDHFEKTTARKKLAVSGKRNREHTDSVVVRAETNKRGRK